ncbi:MAG: hypothetical protein JNM63_15885, partial [Spirochaetia bacterium]|nr:hypothetical protein [Spirochaetia bacterium]
MGDPEYQKKYGMVTIESDIINIHGSLRDIEHEILEKQQLVIATGSMPMEEWVRTRAFCWMVALVHFDKILQIPIILLRKLSGLRYRQIFELFTAGDLKDYPTLAEVRSFFIQMAKDIQAGKPEYHHSKEYLDIFWPADEWILIKLISEKRIDHFYAEARRLILSHLPKDKPELIDIFEDAIRLNQSLLKLPFQESDLEVRTHYNVWAVYRAAVMGEDLPLEKTPCEYHIDRTSLVWKSWDDYCREVIWYGNKKGAYLYNNLSAEKQIAGIY